MSDVSSDCTNEVIGQVDPAVVLDKLLFAQRQRDVTRYHTSLYFDRIVNFLPVNVRRDIQERTLHREIWPLPMDGNFDDNDKVLRSLVITIGEYAESLQTACKMLDDAWEHIPANIRSAQVAGIQRISTKIEPTNLVPRYKTYVYVLELEHGKYYVGFSEDMMERLSQHTGGNGAHWTRLFKPIGVVEIIEGDKEMEKRKTIEYMKLKGWQNVRGSQWCRVDLKNPPMCLKRDHVEL